jgi:hypothetical protein
MKKIISCLLAMSICISSPAQTAVQRTTESSFDEYRKYLEQTGGTSFSQAYIQLSSVTTLETPLLEKCLEEMYLGAPSQVTCLSAVKSLGAKPLNQPRREVLYSFLSKMAKVKSPHRSFYEGLRDGLLRTHPDLARTFQTEVPESDDKAPELKNLEMKAWKNALDKKIPLDEASLLINGKKVSKLENWTAPEGIYQWTLISNTHEPFIRFATFSQFAADSLKGLEPLAPGGCSQLETLEPQKFGLLKMEVFANSKCVTQFGMSTTVEEKSEHLGSSSSMVKMEKSSSRHWVWITLAIVGAGVAAGLKGKNVQIQWPGSN